MAPVVRPEHYVHACSVPACVQGRVVDFKNTLIIMTSNVGSSVIEKGGGRIGFQLDLQTEEDSNYNRIKNLVNEELKQYFRCAAAHPWSRPCWGSR